MMTNKEAVNWIINLMADIGKAEHSELWHYEQALKEIKEMLESEFCWTPVSEGLPKDLKPVNITYINEDPAPYYEHIKGIPFTATAIYYRGGWYWWSCICADILAEHGHSYQDGMYEGIEVTAWMPLPEPFKGGDDK